MHRFDGSQNLSLVLELFAVHRLKLSLNTVRNVHDFHLCHHFSGSNHWPQIRHLEIDERLQPFLHLEGSEHSFGLLCGDGKRNRDFDPCDCVSGNNPMAILPASF